jgi:hypothetical protein
MIGAPTSRALSKPLIIPKANVFHPKPIIANIITAITVSQIIPFLYVLLESKLKEL